MATGKRYYWLKLKETFLTSDTVDYFMSQKDGANYVVLYQLLCLKTINTGGRLCRQIGEVIIPYDAEKIQRDCKWFSIDTVRFALNLYQSVGLVYVDNDGVLVMADHDNLVGSSTDWSDKKQRQRALRADNGGDNGGDKGGDKGGDNVPIDIDIRDKRLDTRDKRLEIDTRLSVKERKEEREKVFLKSPSLCSEDFCAASDETAPAEKPKDKIGYKKIADMYNSICKSLPKVNTLSEDRKKHIRARFADGATVDDFRRVFEKAEASGFLKGANKRGWSAKFDWLILDRNFAKVLDGNYDNSYDAPTASPAQTDLAARAEYERTDAYFDEGGPRVAWGDTAECQELYKQHWRELCYDGCMERMIHDKQFVAEKLALWAAMPEGEREKYNAHKS